jgi:hypothetical protein
MAPETKCPAMPDAVIAGLPANSLSKGDGESAGRYVKVYIWGSLRVQVGSKKLRSTATNGGH